MPNGITSIDWAFYGCTSLQSVKLPNNITSIDKSAFSGCTGLQDIELPDSITSIGEWAFYGCTGLQDIELSDSITSIGERAFYGCTGLQDIELTNNITSIGKWAFGSCDNLGLVRIAEDKLYKYKDAFSDVVYKTTLEALNLAKSQEEKAQRKADGLCPYCGGEFKGIFSLKCKKCGKPKDY